MMHALMLLWTMTAAVAAPVPGVERSATVAVRATPQVPGATFRLRDIAEITGSDAALARQLADVEVGTSPLAGLSRALFPSDIVVRLRSRGIDPKRVDLQCPPSIRVTRAAAEAPAEAVIEAARAALTEARGAAAADEIAEPMPMVTRLLVTPGKLEYRPGAPHGRPENGLMSVPVTVVVDGAPVKTVDVAFRIRRAVPAVVALRQIEANTVLRAEDLTLARIEAPAGAVVITDPQAVVGKRTTRRVAQGAPVTEAVVGTVKVIASGARVSVMSSAGGVTITAPGTARGAAGIGERIRVWVDDTKKELAAIVVDETTVRLEDR